MYLVGRTKPDPNFINTIKAPATHAKLVFQSITLGESVAPNFDTQPYTLAESDKIDRAMCNNIQLLIV
jgi:hypothetical protein